MEALSKQGHRPCRTVALTDLPDDLLIYILELVGPEKCARMMMANRRLRRVARHDFLWEKFFLEEFKSCYFGEDTVSRGWFSRFISLRCPVSCVEEKQINRVGEWLLFTGQADSLGLNRSQCGSVKERKRIEDARLTTFECLRERGISDEECNIEDPRCTLREVLFRLSVLLGISLRTAIHLPYAFSRAVFRNNVDLPDDFLLDDGEGGKIRTFRKNRRKTHF